MQYQFNTKTLPPPPRGEVAYQILHTIQCRGRGGGGGGGIHNQLVRLVFVPKFHSQSNTKEGRESSESFTRNQDTNKHQEYKEEELLASRDVGNDRPIMHFKKQQRKKCGLRGRENFESKLSKDMGQRPKVVR